MCVCMRGGVCISRCLYLCLFVGPLLFVCISGQLDSCTDCDGACHTLQGHDQHFLTTHARIFADICSHMARIQLGQA